jgi:BA14K-like protein
MRINLKTTVTALAIAATTLVAIAPAQAQWRGGYHRHGYYGGGAALGGFAAGAILGGALAAQGPYYRQGYAPGYYAGGGDQDAYCFSRFKSYDPGSGTYLGYDGRRHSCP